MSDFIDPFLDQVPCNGRVEMNINDVLFEALLALIDSFECEGHSRTAAALEVVLDEFVNICWPSPRQPTFRSRRSAAPLRASSDKPLLLTSPKPPVRRMPTSLKGQVPPANLSFHSFPLARLYEMDRFVDQASDRPPAKRGPTVTIPTPKRLTRQLG